MSISTARRSPTSPSAMPRPSARSPRSRRRPDPARSPRPNPRRRRRSGVRDSRASRARNPSRRIPTPPMDLAQLSADLEALRARAVQAAAEAPDTAALDALDLEVLGKKGELTAILRGIGSLPPEDRPKVGA